MLRALMGVPFIHRVDRSLLSVEPRDDMRRLGSTFDGGYVVATEAIVRATRLLSFGVATNWDFERDALALNASLMIDAFDPSVGPRKFAEIAVRSAVSAPLRLIGANPRGALSSLRRAKTAISYFRFFSRNARHTQKRVWYNADRDSAAIGDILAGLQSHDRCSLFAKIDIEGSEYRILPWIIDDADLFSGLVVEFHQTDICADLFNEQIRQLSQYFRIVHVHGNNYDDLAVDGSLPLTLEISFVHRELASRRAERSMQLDAPNDPNRPDYIIDLLHRHAAPVRPAARFG